MNRDSKKFEPGRFSRLLIPFFLIVLTLILGGLLAAIVFSMFQVFP
ncbi:MAG: hypothetical protein R3335_08595 [Anaerolineales bacterium]|nr:hypothetical protein [Anaerolineales bacterium]